MNVDPLAKRNASYSSCHDVWKYISELGISKVNILCYCTNLIFSFNHSTCEELVILATLLLGLPVMLILVETFSSLDKLASI